MLVLGCKAIPFLIHLISGAGNPITRACNFNCSPTETLTSSKGSTNDGCWALAAIFYKIYSKCLYALLCRQVYSDFKG